MNFTWEQLEELGVDRKARAQQNRLNDFLKNQHGRQRKADMDKVCWLPGTKAGERFKGEAEYADFDEVKPVILL
jgi:hypothetical protein